jgi:hypothetical protein
VTARCWEKPGTEATQLVPQRIANHPEREERPAVKCGIVGICLEISGGWRPIEFWKFNALPAVREAESNNPRRKAVAVRLQHFEQERSQAGHCWSANEIVLIPYLTNQTETLYRPVTGPSNTRDIIAS